MHHNETHKRAVRHFMAFSVRRDKRPMSVCLSCLCLTVCLSISMSMSMSVCLSQSNCLSVYVYVCLQEHPYVVVRKGLLQFGPHSACSEADRVWFEAICSRLKAFEGFWSWSILSLSWSDLVRSDSKPFEKSTVLADLAVPSKSALHLWVPWGMTDCQSHRQSSLKGPVSEKHFC